jgi:hypothetical protein
MSRWPTQLGSFSGTLDKVLSRPPGPLWEIRDVPCIPTSTILVLSCHGFPDQELDLERSSFRLEDAMLPKPYSVVGDASVGVIVGGSPLWSELLEITTSTGPVTLAAKNPALL